MSGTVSHQGELRARRLLRVLHVDEPDDPAQIRALLQFIRAELTTLASLSAPARRARVAALREVVHAVKLVSAC